MDIQHLFTFLLALGISLVIIPILIRNSTRMRLMDIPTGDSRKIHQESMPRSGGLGIVLSAGIALMIMFPLDKSLFSFLLGSIVIIGFGLLDDIVKLSPPQKLAGQALGVAIAMAGGMVMYDFPILTNSPSWFVHVVTFVFVMGVINGVNFSDGMDGLAAGTTLMALLLIIVLALESGNFQIAAIGLAVVAALLGFLRFNTHPARVFMGDSGSQFLGFVVAWLIIMISQSESSAITRLMPLLVLGIPVIDILQVVPVRVHKKLPLLGPDNEHLHHQVAKLGFHQEEVVAIMYILQAILLGGAYLLRFASDSDCLLFYVIYGSIILGAIYIANVRGWKVRTPGTGDSMRRRSRFFRRLGVLHPYTGKFFGITVAIFLALAAVQSDALSPSLIYIALGWAGGLFAFKVFSNNRWPIGLGRMASYPTVALLTYGLTLSVTSQVGNYLIDFFLAVLALLLALAVRITRKRYFWLTTQDLLVLLFLLFLVPFLSFDIAYDLSAGRLIFRTFVLLYVCEYVLARGGRAPENLATVTIIALSLLGVHLKLFSFAT